MKKLLLVFLSLMCLSQVKGQQSQSDTLGHYYNRQISYYDWRQIKKIKTFGDRTIQIQTQYPSGRIAQEFSRYDDAHFLFTEYYEFPDTSIQFKGSTWGILREGLVQIVAGSLKDTIVTFDPETYEEHYYFDSLLLPIGKWTYFFPGGRIRLTGSYANYEREGNWLSSDKIGLPEKTEHYQHGNLISTQFHNIILVANPDSTLTHLKGIWGIIDPSADPGTAKDPKLSGYKYLYRIDNVWGNNNSYNFKDATIVEYTRIKTTEYKDKKDANGNYIVSSHTVEGTDAGYWKLTAYNLLEITLDKQTERYQIEYLSDQAMRIRMLVE